MGDWIAFWDSEHSIYVNARHRDVHYRTIAQDLRAGCRAAQRCSTSAAAMRFMPTSWPRMRGADPVRGGAEAA